MKKMHMILTTIFATGIILTGCGTNDKENKEEPKQEKESKDETEVKADAATKKDDTEESTGSEETAEGTSDYEELNKYMEEQTEGTAKVVYENEKPQEHKLDELTASLESYELVELKDFHKDFDIPFDGDTNGGVLVANFKVHNGSDKDLYYMPSFDLTFTGADRTRRGNTELLPEDEQISNKLAPSDNYLIKAGDTVTGYQAYPLGQEALKKVLDLSTVSIQVPTAFSKKDDFGSTVGSEGKFHLSLNEQGDKKVEKDASFYKDKVTTENMGEKKMLKAKEDINDKEKIGDTEVTFNGYQFTEFKPNSEEAPRFESFKNGIVLLTAKFTLDNQGSKEIGTSSIGSTLHMNDGSQYTINEGMLLNRKYSDVINPKESGEILHIYTIDQEQYEKILKDKSFEIEIGPMLDKEGKDISKGRKATFELPK